MGENNLEYFAEEHRNNWLLGKARTCFLANTNIILMQKDAWRSRPNSGRRWIKALSLAKVWEPVYLSILCSVGTRNQASLPLGKRVMNCATLRGVSIPVLAR